MPPIAGTGCPISGPRCKSAPGFSRFTQLLESLGRGRFHRLDTITSGAVQSISTPRSVVTLPGGNEKCSRWQTSTLAARRRGADRARGHGRAGTRTERLAAAQAARRRTRARGRARLAGRRRARRGLANEGRAVLADPPDVPDRPLQPALAAEGGQAGEADQGRDPARAATGSAAARRSAGARGSQAGSRSSTLAAARPLGPQPQVSTGCQAPCFTFGLVSGRVNAIAFDPVNTNVAYIAQDGGGIWKTTNCCSPSRRGRSRPTARPSRRRRPTTSRSTRTTPTSSTRRRAT